MAKKRRIQKYVPDDIKENLNEKQILFCRLYSYDKDCYGNAARSYSNAYNLNPRQHLKFGRVCGYQLLANPYIKKYIESMLLTSFNDRMVDGQHSRLIAQDKNLIAKLGAIQEYNKVKKRVEEAKVAKIEFAWKGDGKNEPPDKSGKGVSPKKPTPKSPKGKFIIEVTKK